MSKAGIPKRIPTVLRAVFTLIVLGLLTLGLLPIVYVKFPELFGHFRFYRTCKALEPGMSIGDARTSMRAFLEVGRSYHPRNTLEGQLFGAQIAGTRETGRERASRVLFIPDAKNGADWCVVYTDRTGVAVERVELAPD